MSNLFVVSMGIGIVFFGLVFIIFLCLIMSAIIKLFEKKSNSKTPVVPAPAVEEKEENRQEIIAAVSAAVAEDLGKDISAIRILSFKKI